MRRRAPESDNQGVVDLVGVPLQHGNAPRDNDITPPPSPWISLLCRGVSSQ